eukprot:10602503-Alexandrium_andersonii.AAC.1
MVLSWPIPPFSTLRGRYHALHLFFRGALFPLNQSRRCGLDPRMYDRSFWSARPCLKDLGPSGAWIAPS